MEDFSSPLLARIFAHLRQHTEHGAQPSLALLAEHFTNEEISVLTEILNEPQELSQGEKALNDYIKIIKTEKLAKQQNSGGEGPNLIEIANKMRESKGYGG